MNNNIQSDFSIQKSIEVLESTPIILQTLFSNLSETWVSTNEGGDTWSPFDIVGHFIHGDMTDWIIRAKVILSHRDDKTFETFDRFAQFENSKNKSISELVTSFSIIRRENILELKNMMISADDLKLTGNHPELGLVNLRQLIATWVVHDLSHLAHIYRIMANQYKYEVGPWIKYLRILE